MGCGSPLCAKLCERIFKDSISQGKIAKNFVFYHPQISGQMSPDFSLFWGKMDIGIYVPKIKKNENEKRKNQPL